MLTGTERVRSSHVLRYRKVKVNFYHSLKGLIYCFIPLIGFDHPYATLKLCYTQRSAIGLLERGRGRKKRENKVRFCVAGSVAINLLIIILFFIYYCTIRKNNVYYHEE